MAKGEKRPKTGKKKKQDFIVSRPERVKKFMVAISNGYNYRVCCAFAGISQPAFYIWKAKGKEEFEKLQAIENGEKAGENGEKIEYDKDYAKFYADLLYNESLAEIKLNQRIVEAAEKDWKAASWILERRFKESGDYQATQKMEIKTDSLSDASDEELARRYAKLKAKGLLDSDKKDA